MASAKTLAFNRRIPCRGNPRATSCTQGGEGVSVKDRWSIPSDLELYPAALKKLATGLLAMPHVAGRALFELYPLLVLAIGQPVLRGLFSRRPRPMALTVLPPFFHCRVQIRRQISLNNDSS